MVLIIDNYDSFTYNLVHYVEELTGIMPCVMRNDEIDYDRADAFSQIILSPGPGLPHESGDLMKVIGRYHLQKKILGVCLGHQALGVFFGAELQNMPKVQHGVASPIEVDTGDILYRSLPSEIFVGRYHSWTLKAGTLPSCLHPTAHDEDNYIMSFRHTELPVTGVQYHPESVLTPQGKTILRNWLM
jgi:anthranilate synthase component 2